MRHDAGGFTLVELVTVIVILGILAAVAMPRMDTSIYRMLEFHDKTVAALRFAQKTATSHRRLVCVTFPSVSTVQLTIDKDKDGVCDTALSIPGAAGNQVISSDPVSTAFNPLPATLSFAADGTTANRNLVFKDATIITIVGATGYVQ